MKDLPSRKFDNDEVMEQLDQMLENLGKQKLSVLPTVSTQSFTPVDEPPQYPKPPPEFNISLRRVRKTL